MTATYDAGNRVTQLVDTAAGTITRTYDGLDRLTQETTPQGAVSYTYDAASQLLNVRRSAGASGAIVSSSYAYDAAGRTTLISHTIGTDAPLNYQLIATMSNRTTRRG